MATRFVTNLDLVQNQILNGRFESVSSDPTTGNFDGRLIFNTTEGVIKVYDAGIPGWRKALTEVTSSTTALAVSESNGSVDLSIADAVNGGASGLMTGSDKTKLDNATSSNTANTLALRDANGRLQVTAPENDLDAANKAYVDAARSGLDVKQSVRAATTGPINLATDLENGDTLDTTVTLATGDRVLVKNQSTASENGIYVVQASGAAVRATDFDSSAEVTPGSFTFVEEGTVNGDSGWVVITDGTITLGTTGIEWAQFSGTGQIVAGDALEKDGNTLNVLVDETSIEVSGDELRIASGAAGDGLGYNTGVLSVNVKATGGIEIDTDELAILLDPAVSGLTTTGDGLALDTSIAGDGLTFTAGVLSVDTIDLTTDISGILPIANGGTNASDEATARTNLAYTSPTGANTSTPVLARVASKVIGDGASTSFVVTHNFGTRAVVVQVFDSSTYDTVITDVVRTTTDSVTVSFSVAPASGAFTVVVTG